MFKSFFTKNSFSLVELIVTLAIFSIVIMGVSLVISDNFRSLSDTENKIQIQNINNEVYQVLYDKSKNSWVDIVRNTNNGTKFLDYQSDKYQILTGLKQNGSLSYSFLISDVYRDASSNIVTTGGTLDTHSRKVTINVDVKQFSGLTKTYTNTFYINDWSSLAWNQSTQGEFSLGTLTNTSVTNISGGEVQLSSLQAGSWQNPSLITALDVPGSYDQGESVIVGDYLYAIFKHNGNNNTNFVIVDTKNKANLKIVTSYDLSSYQFIFRDIKVSGNYVYLLGEGIFSLIDTVVVLDVSNPISPQIINLYIVPFSLTLYNMEVSNNKCYILDNNLLIGNELKILNCSDPRNISQIKSFDIPSAYSTSNILSINGNKLFLGSSNNSNEIAYIDITNDNSISVNSSLNLSGNADVLSLNSVGTLLFVGRTNASEKEFSILDVSNPLQMKVVGGIDLNGDLKGMSVSLDDNFVFAATTYPQQQFVVIDIANISVPKVYSYLQTDGKGLSVNLSNNYAYLISTSSLSEIQLIFGGRNGNGTGYGYGVYEVYGTYVSNVFNTGANDPNYIYLTWSANTPTNTSLQFQVRTSDSTTDILSQAFVGPDGTSDSYFTDPNNSLIPEVLQGGRYVQYYVDFISDGAASPTLNDVSIYYQ